MPGRRVPRLLCETMSDQSYEFLVDEGGTRLDRFLADRIPGLSRSAVKSLIDHARVAVNGDVLKASYKVRPGDVVVAHVPALKTAMLAAEAIPLSIVYEDEALLVIDKPAGMVVHPAPGHTSGTLLNAVLAYCPELKDSDDSRPGIVHRLDRDTSGLILVAKDSKTQRLLQHQFKERQVRKAYLALLDGHLEPAWGRIEAPIGRDPHHRQRMTVLRGGREAITEYHVLERYAHQVGPAAGDYTLAEAEPKTGRTHQIRVHLASIGHPVVGDEVYGRRKSGLDVPRHFLHALRLGFKHPITRKRMELETPLPGDLAAVLDLLRDA
jgi:23S rRNA pseudouridine1911/1915/1917 synthase